MIDDMSGLLDDTMLAISEGTSNHQEELVDLTEVGHLRGRGPAECAVN